MLVVDGSVKSYVIFEPLAFFVGSGDANDAAAMDFADLAGNTAGGARGGGDDERFSFLGLTYFSHSEISGQAGDAEYAQKSGFVDKGNRGDFLIGDFGLGFYHRVFLHARHAKNFVAFFEMRVFGFDDFGQATGTHDFTDGYCGEIAIGGHPDAHSRIDREVFDFGEGLAFGDFRQRRFAKLKVACSQEAFGARLQAQLAVRCCQLEPRFKTSVRLPLVATGEFAAGIKFKETAPSFLRVNRNGCPTLSFSANRWL